MELSEDILPIDVWDRIFESLNLPELHRLSVTSRAFYVAVRNHLNLRFRLLLKEYVSDVSEFRCLMWNSEVVISGSRALQFVMPTPSPAWTIQPADLDLYAPLDQEDEILAQLLDEEGYRLDRWLDNLSIPPFPNKIHDEHTMYNMSQDIARIITVSHPKRQKSIDIIVSDSSSPLTAIFAFHSTPVMNWISAYSVTVAYPLMTFNGRGLISALNFAGSATVLSHRVQYALLKYRDGRHFTFATDPSEWEGVHACGTRHNCLQTIRHSNDVGTAFMTFSPRRRMPKDTSRRARRRDVKVGAIWRLGGSLCALGNDSNRQYGKGMQPFRVAVSDLTRRW
ncbi:hypothetical protein BD410DRAFT_842079 [Rickenella mellea]|uniref:F-box domain-containing protein n=1 Tax=Rickenella mellea TaxID=50990 RepID=A0A4Y7PVB2_9AGAM|nr:hypothetical protein BD410DRAFT_842079 [Rickenella mellea]